MEENYVPNTTISMPDLSDGDRTVIERVHRI